MPSDARSWIDEAADLALENHRHNKPEGGPLVCASGASPSGPVHLGNLREVLTTHFVVEELRRRGHEVVHLHSWDDYDRFRKVPVGTPEEWSQYVGRPLSEVPDPSGEHASWADRYITQCEQALERLGVRMKSVRQSIEYPVNRAYTEQIHHCMVHRLEIFDVLARYQTEKLQTVSLEERRANYWPFRVYDPETRKDTTTTRGYDPSSRTVTYRCNESGLEKSFSLHDACPGKLVWKVDWPMRWHHEKVDFEPGGPDHSAPAGSYTVGKALSPMLFAWRPPAYIQYAFVGFGGMTKMSSSSGAVPTPEDGLRVMEPALLRWLYLRRKSTKSFEISFGTQMWRAYGEFDRLKDKIDADKAGEVEALSYARAVTTSDGELALPTVQMPFRTLWTAIDVSGGAPGVLARVLRDNLDEVELPERDEELLAALEPRLSCARNWIEEFVPTEDRILPRSAFGADAWAALSEEQRGMVGLLVSRMRGTWTASALETLVYGVPKLTLGLALDDGPTPEVKALQKAFFQALYQLLLDKNRGPRLPTLLVSLGPDRAASLLTPPG